MTVLILSVTHTKKSRRNVTRAISEERKSKENTERALCNDSLYRRLPSQSLLQAEE